MVAMAKPKAPPEDKVPSFPATPAYKQWVWDEIRRRKWKQQDLVDAVKRADRAQTGGRLTAKWVDGTGTGTSWLTSFLGGEKDKRRYASNTELMPALNKALGIAPPSVCDPLDPLAQLKDRLDSLWRRLTSAERERFLRSMESVLDLVDQE